MGNHPFHIFIPGSGAFGQRRCIFFIGRRVCLQQTRERRKDVNTARGVVGFITGVQAFSALDFGVTFDGKRFDC